MYTQLMTLQQVLIVWTEITAWAWPWSLVKIDVYYLDFRLLNNWIAIVILYHLDNLFDLYLAFIVHYMTCSETRKWQSLFHSHHQVGNWQRTKTRFEDVSIITYMYTPTIWTWIICLVWALALNWWKADSHWELNWVLAWATSALCT